MYTLKPPFQTNCSQCQKKIVVNFSPPRQCYSNKNNWGYWTGKKENEGKYICDDCLIDLYRNQKLTYLNSITDSKKRRTFRDYFGGSMPLTRTQQKILKRSKGKFYHLLEREGIDLSKEELKYIKNWQQTISKLVQENARQAKKIQELEKQLAKKK